MSKTVYLLAPNGNGFLAFGAGCVLTVSEGNVLASTSSGFGICLQSFDRDVKKASGHLALWASAIATAPEGGLLRWDSEKQCVVDELAEGEEAFADDLDPFSHDETDYCPVCGCEMVIAFDGAEWACSSEECDARQPLARAT